MKHRIMTKRLIFNKSIVDMRKKELEQHRKDLQQLSIEANVRLQAVIDLQDAKAGLKKRSD